MTKSLEDRIRERAYELWEREGRVHGRADEHWLKASLEVIGALAGEELTQAPPATARAPASEAASPQAEDRPAAKEEAKSPRQTASKAASKKAASKKAPATKTPASKSAAKAKKSPKPGEGP